MSPWKESTSGLCPGEHFYGRGGGEGGQNLLRHQCQAVVRPNEKAWWEGLAVYYMTDESDNSDDTSIVKHVTMAA